MPRGYHKQWHPSIEAGVVYENPRYINPMPRGSHPDPAQQHRGNELVATEQESHAGYQVVHGRSIADFWAIKDSPINDKGNKAMRKEAKVVKKGSYGSGSGSGY